MEVFGTGHSNMKEYQKRVKNLELENLTKSVEDCDKMILKMYNKKVVGVFTLVELEKDAIMVGTVNRDKAELHSDEKLVECMKNALKVDGADIDPDTFDMIRKLSHLEGLTEMAVKAEDWLEDNCKDKKTKDKILRFLGDTCEFEIKESFGGAENLAKLMAGILAR